MNNVSRRALLRSTAMLPVALVAGCGGSNFLSTIGTVDMTKAASELQVIAGFVTNVTALLPTGAGTKVAAVLADVRSKVAQVTATVSSVMSQPLVLAIENDLTTAITALRGSGLLPASVSQGFSDALTVIGDVKTAVGIVSQFALAPAPGEVDAALARLRAPLRV